jgi:regulator of ribosome biosynthesis
MANVGVSQFAPTELGQEKDASLALLSKMEMDARKAKKDPGGGTDEVLNVRKAVRFASKGRGGVALGREKSDRQSSKKTRR